MCATSLIHAMSIFVILFCNCPENLVFESSTSVLCALHFACSDKRSRGYLTQWQVESTTAG